MAISASARAPEPRRRVRALARVATLTALSAVLASASMAPGAHGDVPAEARGIDEEELDGGDTTFDDTRGNVHRDHIQALAARGIVQGHADGSYRPHEPVRRDAMASFVGRAMDYLAAQGHWPVPSTVQLSPAEDTDPADFIHAADEFVVHAPRRDLPAASLEHFECALQAARAQGDEVYPALNADYDPRAPSTFELSTQADVGHCVASIPEPFSFQERASVRFPEGGPANLTAVHPVVQDVADRLLFEVPGEPVGWKVTWEDEPIRGMPSGKRVDVAGEAHLAVQMTAAATWGEGTYEGPDRIPIDGTVATEAVKTHDFEGQTTWVIGLQRVAPFTVDVLSDPQRLVVEVYGGDTEP